MSLWPKEHGAYGQLGLPLLTALAMGTPSLSAVLLCAAAVAVFAAHEPLVVVLGRRGARAQREHARSAVRALVVWTAVAIVCGATGMWIGDAGVRSATALPLSLMLVCVPFVVRGTEKTAAGELIAASTLAAAAIPVAVAGGLSPFTAHLMWAAWSVAFAVTVAAVRCVITNHKLGHGERMGLAIALASTAAFATLAAYATIVWTALPVVIAGWLLIVRPPHPRHLKRVGWTLVGSSALTAALAVAAVRLG